MGLNLTLHKVIFVSHALNFPNFLGQKPALNDQVALWTTKEISINGTL